MAESAKPALLGQYLRNARLNRRMSLRAVEKATGKELSNAYLSQIENGKIGKPSPHILYSISLALAVPYEALMEKAGYILPVYIQPDGEQITRPTRGRVIDNLTEEEETALLEYLEYVRWQCNRRLGSSGIR